MRAPKTRHTLAGIGVGVGVWLGGLGLFISFVPGAETGWFGTAAGAGALGLLSPSKRLRLAGIAVAVACGWFALAGYERGLEYQRWLREQRRNEPGAAPGPAR